MIMIVEICAFQIGSLHRLRNQDMQLLSCIFPRVLIWEKVPPHKGMTEGNAWARGLNVIMEHLWCDEKSVEGAM